MIPFDHFFGVLASIGWQALFEGYMIVEFGLDTSAMALYLHFQSPPNVKSTSCCRLSTF